MISLLILIGLPFFCLHAYAFFNIRYKRESIVEATKVACSRRPELPYCNQNQSLNSEYQHVSRHLSSPFTNDGGNKFENSVPESAMNFTVPHINKFRIEQSSIHYQNSALNNVYSPKIISPKFLILPRHLSTDVSTSASKNSLLSSSTLKSSRTTLHETKFNSDLKNSDENSLRSPFLENEEANTTKPKNSSYQMENIRRLDSKIDESITIDSMLQLCQRFLPIVMEHCTEEVVEAQFVEHCQEYMKDCAPILSLAFGEQKTQSALEAIANAYSSGVGLTYYHWGVNGIPFYPINEEGSISNGANGKVDYGSWGGGYSNNFGIRDYWTMNDEASANWYEGLYGYRTGWHVPIVQSLGIEGGGGTQVHVPIKEEDFGKPLHVTNGYFVGPYAGVADSTKIDWLNGRVTTQSGFASPYSGISIGSGSSIGFPSIASIIGQLNSNSKVLHFATDSLSTQQFALPTVYNLGLSFAH